MQASELSEDQKELILEISNDFYRYCENNLKIRDKSGKIIQFVPNRAQRRLIDRVLEKLALGEPIRMIVLKARQMGLSTAIEALGYWWTATHQNVTSMIVAHDDEASGNLYNMFKRYYEHSNPLFQPTRRYNTRRDLTFDVSDDVKAKYQKMGKPSPGLGSIIKTASAQNTSTGRSDTIQFVHGSEVGEWRDGEELVAGLLQTVPLLPDTFVFLESTAKGIGNYFHREWENAQKGDSIFEPFFFPWWQHDEYELDGEIEEYTEDELEIVELMKEAGVTDERRIERKMNFRRYKEREFRAEPRKLYQEYPSTDLEAFLAGGRPRFDIKSLQRMLKHADEVKDETYDLEEDRNRTVKAVKAEDAPLKIWKMPEHGKDYVIGADTAEGLKDGDYSVADVVDTDTLETVARYRGHHDPDQFGRLLDKLGRFYNYALLGVEINNHGFAVVQRLRDLFYTNLYRRERGMDERFEEATQKLGWKTDLRTKPLMIDYLAEAIRDELITDHDVVFVREAMSYIIEDNGKTNAQEGAFDDTVMAKAVALQMFEWSTSNKKDLKAYKPKKMVSRKRQNKVVK